MQADKQEGKNASPENILVIKLGALGDFFQALGPMAAIRRHHKNAQITLLTTQPFAGLAQECGYFDHIIIDTKPKWFQLPAWFALRSLLNRKNFTRIYDLQNNDRTCFYFRLLKSPPVRRSLGEGGKPEWVGIAKGASHRNISPERTAGHAFDGHVHTLKQAGITNIEIDKLEWMNAGISDFGIEDPYILLIPGSAPQHLQKRWPAEDFGELALKLANIGYRPVIIGTNPEVSIAKSIKMLCPDALSLIGKTSLHQIVALARNAAGAIGNDTGPMHLIGPTGCPALVLFSSHSNPVRHTPKGENIQTLQRNNLTDLTVDEVFNTLTKLINK